MRRHSVASGVVLPGREAMACAIQIAPALAMPARSSRPASSSKTQANTAAPCAKRRATVQTTILATAPKTALLSAVSCLVSFPSQSPKTRITQRSMSRFALDLRKLRLLGPSPKRSASLPVLPPRYFLSLAFRSPVGSTFLARRRASVAVAPPACLRHYRHAACRKCACHCQRE